MTNFTLKDIVSDKNFSEIFGNMVNYTLTKKKEATVFGCDSGRWFVNYENGDRTPFPSYLMMIGGIKEDLLNGYLSWKLAQKYTEQFYGDLRLNMHAHPGKELCFSGDDILVFALFGPETISGVVAIQSESEARSLLWRPREEYTLEDLDRLRKSLNIDGERNAKTLRSCGTAAELVDFKLHDGLWQPTKDI